MLNSEAMSGISGRRLIQYQRRISLLLTASARARQPTATTRKHILTKFNTGYRSMDIGKRRWNF